MTFDPVSATVAVAADPPPLSAVRVQVCPALPVTDPPLVYVPLARIEF
jgi:hypothetical protein